MSRHGNKKISEKSCNRQAVVTTAWYNTTTGTEQLVTGVCLFYWGETAVMCNIGACSYVYNSWQQCGCEIYCVHNAARGSDVPPHSSGYANLHILLISLLHLIKNKAEH